MDQHRGQDVDLVLGSGTLFLTALVIYRGSENPLQDERGFELSDQVLTELLALWKEGDRQRY